LNQFIFLEGRGEAQKEENGNATFGSIIAAKDGCAYFCSQ
jgi:hypothetical protein